MRKIKEVLRLEFEIELGNRKIARSCSINHSAVGDYLRCAEAAGLSWPLSMKRGWKRLFHHGGFWLRPSGADWAAIRDELSGDKHATLQLVWQEYKQGNPDGYSYSRFCELYQEGARKLDVVLRQDHRAGEKLLVDYAGDKLPIIDSKTGTIQYASIFVAVLGASNYTFAEATWNQELASWIGSHIRALEFFQGEPALVIPDNLKNAVLRPCRYEPDLNPPTRKWPPVYGIAVIPLACTKLATKAKVEADVLLVEWLDTGRSAQKTPLLHSGRSQPGHRRTGGSAQSSTLSQTRRQPRHSLGETRFLVGDAAGVKRLRVLLEERKRIDPAYVAKTLSLGGWVEPPGCYGFSRSAARDSR